MSSDESSELSSVPSDTEGDLQLTNKDGILKFFTKAPKSTSSEAEVSPNPKRDPSPPHSYILADNPDIAFVVMFRSRFAEAFPKNLVNFGPQELERDVVEAVPGEGVENFLCALLGLLLNRKQDVKPGHYNRALEEAIQTHKSQWPKVWDSKNPLSGSNTFSSMAPDQRLTLLRTLILWALSSSDLIRSIIQSSYKQTRHEDDLNQPLSVQPWGCDSNKRRYYLIEGLDDTHFRVYRESNYLNTQRTWWSVASNIDELKALGVKLHVEDGGQRARLLSGRILAAIPRFEAAEEKRKRREYRSIRKHQFKYSDSNFLTYEGRTRGKRIKYTFSDDEDTYADLDTPRRSSRNPKTDTHTELNGPTITQSGRMVKSRQGGAYGESILSKACTTATNTGDDVIGIEDNDAELCGGRPRRAAAGYGYHPKPDSGRFDEDHDHADETSSEEESDSNEQDYHVEGDDDHLESDFDESVDIFDDQDMDKEPKKLIVKLAVRSPTPERKTMIKLRLSPKKTTSLSATSLSPNEQNQDTRAPAANLKEKIKPVLHSPHVDQTPMNPLGVPKSQSTLHNITQSPSLLLRGSLENPKAYPASIDVGYGGS